MSEYLSGHNYYGPCVAFYFLEYYFNAFKPVRTGIVRPKTDLTFPEEFSFTRSAQYIVVMFNFPGEFSFTRSCRDV